MRQQPKLPRYQQLADHVREQVLAGHYTKGDRLPSEQDLCRRFGVSRGTVVKAFDQLVEEGIALRRQGAGTFVAHATLRREPGRLSSFSEAVAAQGKRASQRLVSFAPADVGLATSLGCFEPAMCLTRLRLVDDVTSSVHATTIPVSVLDRLRPKDADRMADPAVRDFSLYAAFRAAGIEITHAMEQITARLATAEEANAFAIQPPAAVMIVTRRSTDADGRLIEATEAAYQSGYYTYEVPLVRGETRATPFRVQAPTEGPNPFQQTDSQEIKT